MQAFRGVPRGPGIPPGPPGSSLAPRSLCAARRRPPPRPRPRRAPSSLRCRRAARQGPGSAEGCQGGGVFGGKGAFRRGAAAGRSLDSCRFPFEGIASASRLRGPGCLRISSFPKRSARCRCVESPPSEVAAVSTTGPQRERPEFAAVQGAKNCSITEARSQSSDCSRESSGPTALGSGIPIC